MSGETRNGKCRECHQMRYDHVPDEEGLSLICPDGSGGRFAWPRTPGRASASFSEAELVVLDALVAHAMGASVGVSRTNPELAKIRRKTIAMKRKATA